MKTLPHHIYNKLQPWQIALPLLFIMHFFCIQFTSAELRKVRIYGYVIDTDNRGIEYANVYAKGSTIGTTTNKNGYYDLQLETNDSITIVYSMLGYKTIEHTFLPDQRVIQISVELQSEATALSGVEIRAHHKQIGTMERMEAEQVRMVPDATGGSIESLLITFAGVSQTNELSSQYSVRGGNFDENSVYVNGIEVYRPLLIRSGQQEGLSFVNPEMVANVSFSAGGYDAKYGDKMSSVLDITYKKPKQLEGSASISLLGANAYVGSSTGKFSQITGFRYKTNRSLLSTTDTEAEYDPDFIDFQTSMTYQFNPKWEANILGNISHNRYRFTPHTRETSFGTASNLNNFTVYFDGKEEDVFKTLFGSASLKYKPDNNTEAGVHVTAFKSNEIESYDITGEYWLNDGSNTGNDLTISRSTGVYHEHARNRLTSRIINIGHSGTKRINNNTLKWGATLQLENIADRINEWERRDSSGYSLPHTGTEVNVISNLYSDNNISSTRFSFYVQDAFKFRSKQGLFNLTGGIRGSYWSFNKEFIFSPRLSLGFIPNFNQNLTFRIAGGIYYQSPFYKELRLVQTDNSGNNIVTLNNHLKSQRSIHAIAGSDYTFKIADRNFKLTAEVYYKKLDNLIPYTIDNVKIRYYGENCAKGNAYGLDLKLFGEFVEGVDSWISVSLMKAEQTIRNSVTVPMPNSQGYNLSLFFQDYFPGYKRLKLNLKGVLSGGLPLTAPHQGYENGYFRTPPYKRVDIGLSYQLAGDMDAVMERRIFRSLKSIWIGFDVFNLFDIKNTNSYYWITRADNDQAAVPNYLTGRQFNVKLIVDF